MFNKHVKLFHCIISKHIIRNMNKIKLIILLWKYRLAAALSKHNIWVMNVVPVHAPDTLPIIFERGFFGVYHDWCESFGTYPRTYDLLHADHLFSRLKNRYWWNFTYIVVLIFLLMFFHDHYKRIIKWEYYLTVFM
jgi:hypothetical protein